MEVVHNIHPTVRAFLIEWPVDSILSMTLQKYANLDDHRSFCYWLEYGSKDLGEIGGIALNKFCLWKYKTKKEFGEGYLSNNTYAWVKGYGDTVDSAFRNIRQAVYEIAVAASHMDLDTIEKIKFHSVAKWKIAYMYSEGRLLPIYTRDALLKITYGLGGNLPENSPIPYLQEFILSRKQSDQSQVEYMGYLWDHYVKNIPFRRYFIVGSRYKNANGEDTKNVFPQMLASNTIAIGFLYDFDCTNFVGSTEEAIQEIVEENRSAEEPEAAKLVSYFSLFLNLRPGDIIAVKSKGAYGKLEIIGYAVVVSRNGKVYEYRPNELGHHINVEFIEWNTTRKTGLNYAGTIHRIQPEKREHLNQIFGPLLNIDNVAVPSESEILDYDDELPQKSESDYLRGPIAAKMIRQLHSILQNSLIKQLRVQYPNDKIHMEYERRVDILRENHSERWLYEIKPYESVMKCLREATGQLLEYLYLFSDGKRKTHLVVVGTGSEDAEAVNMISHYQELIKTSLTYQQHTLPEKN